MEQLTSLTVYDALGDCSTWTIPDDLRELRKELYGSRQNPYGLAGVVFHFQSGDLKDRLVYLTPELGELVKLHLELSRTEVYFCLTVGVDCGEDFDDEIEA
jgi:hypothetical protein